MTVSTEALRTEDLGETLLDVLLQLELLTSRTRRRNGDLKELEMLTLSILNQRQTMIVGDIQRILGVLPAQMSRVIRGLESRPRPLIQCRINSDDKRKIDVSITQAGKRAYDESKSERLDKLAALLDRISSEERDDLRRNLDKIREVLGEAIP